MNIDLFVFFSVFFSSFFLFLSIGICFWKVKFAYEIHRRRRTLKHEYHKRMARPFAKIQLLIKPSTLTPHEQDNSQQVRLESSFFFSKNSVVVFLCLVNSASRFVVGWNSFASSVDTNRHRLFVTCRGRWAATWPDELLYHVAFSFARRSVDTVSTLCRNDTRTNAEWLCQRVESRENRSGIAAKE